MEELLEERSERILNQLHKKFPGKKAFDLDGRGLHFVCEVEPTGEHPEYDVAIEVIISSQPHKHRKSRQFYKVLSGDLKLVLGQKTLQLGPGDTCAIEPGTVHSASSENECWVEIRSEPGWTAEDHIPA